MKFKITLYAMTLLAGLVAVPGLVGTDQVPSKDGKKHEPMEARTFLEKGRASGSLPEGIAWGDAVNGLQLGIFPDAGTNGFPATLFDGRTLHVNVQVRNAGKSPVRILPSTFGCAALGPDGAIPVTKLILTPSQGGEPLSIAYQGANHVSDEHQLDAEDQKYYTTVLSPGQALRFSYPVQFTPGEDRATSWQRTGESNLVPEGKYQLKAVFIVDRKVSPWKGELTSGALEVVIPPSGKK